MLASVSLCDKLLFSVFHTESMQNSYLNFSCDCLISAIKCGLGKLCAKSKRYKLNINTVLDITIHFQSVSSVKIEATSITLFQTVFLFFFVFFIPDIQQINAIDNIYLCIFFLICQNLFICNEIF
jgi:hypothetical protein